MGHRSLNSLFWLCARFLGSRIQTRLRCPDMTVVGSARGFFCWMRARFLGCCPAPRPESRRACEVQTGQSSDLREAFLGCAPGSWAAVLQQGQAPDALAVSPIWALQLDDGDL